MCCANATISWAKTISSVSMNYKKNWLLLKEYDYFNPFLCIIEYFEHGSSHEIEVFLLTHPANAQQFKGQILALSLSEGG